MFRPTPWFLPHVTACPYIRRPWVKVEAKFASSPCQASDTSLLAVPVMLLCRVLPRPSVTLLPTPRVLRPRAIAEPAVEEAPCRPLFLRRGDLDAADRLWPLSGPDDTSLELRPSATLLYEHQVEADDFGSGLPPVFPLQPNHTATEKTLR
jgi:hypothetical protein